MLRSKKFTITATIVFELDAQDTQDAADMAYVALDAGVLPPESIQVWDKEGTNHWFADRYTYTNPPVFIEPNPQGPKTIMPSKVEA